MSNSIRAARKAAGVSVSGLAEKLGVSPAAVSQMEASERADTIQLRTLRRAHAALGGDLAIEHIPTDSGTPYAPYRIADSLNAHLQSGDDTAALRILTDAIQVLSRHTAAIPPQAIAATPPEVTNPLWDTLFRALYAHELGADAPSWAVPRPLPAPTYVFPLPSLMKRADAATPDWLRTMNVLIDERSLSRA